MEAEGVPYPPVDSNPPTPLSQEDFELIEGVSLESLQPSTRASYGAGLLAFHIYCDSKRVDESLRAPVDLVILQSFIAKMAGIYSASTISGYVAAIRAWHVVHGVAWTVDGPSLNAIVKGAQRMAPKESVRQKREPVAIEYIEKNLSTPLQNKFTRRRGPGMLNHDLLGSSETRGGDRPEFISLRPKKTHQEVRFG